MISMSLSREITIFVYHIGWIKLYLVNLTLMEVLHNRCYNKLQHIYLNITTVALFL